MTRTNQGEHGADTLKRGLENRHIQLIAIGGAIGTGLFMGSGKTIHVAGPSIILVYLIIGFMLYFVMRAMGEILLSDLSYKSFRDFAADLLGPWAGFYTGWSYWFCWIVTAIADIIAITGYLQMWFPHLWPSAVALFCVLFFLVFNLATVRLFGELEFWFALIKVITILALVAMGIYMAVTGFVSPNGTAASFSNLWLYGGFFPNGAIGFFGGFQIAMFAFVGIELVGTAAAETRNPGYNLPKAINSIPVRIVVFYILALAAIMIVTPWYEVAPNKSPFVQLFLLAGLTGAAHIINFVVLTSAASSANSGIFSTSRMIYGLAQDDVAPKKFGLLSSRFVPAYGLLFSCAVLLVGVLFLEMIPDIMEAFVLVTTVAAILFMFVWSIILLSYLVYRRKRPEAHLKSAYKMPWGVAMSVVVLIFFGIVLYLLTLDKTTMSALLMTPFWFIILTLAWFWVRFHVRQKQNNE